MHGRRIEIGNRMKEFTGLSGIPGTSSGAATTSRYASSPNNRGQYTGALMSSLAEHKYGQPKLRPLKRSSSGKKNAPANGECEFQSPSILRACAERGPTYCSDSIMFGRVARVLQARLDSLRGKRNYIPAIVCSCGCRIWPPLYPASVLGRLVVYRAHCHFRLPIGVGLGFRLLRRKKIKGGKLE